MAHSSTSSIHKSFKYDVFLSFRGEDTRKNFVDHLFHALQEKSIHTYKDDERINKGKRISDELMGSIEDSRFSIIVFSKNYASSSWCLNELLKIMECHMTTEHTAYPVFYDVEPSEVRNQIGEVKNAFDRHVNKEAFGKWREALKEAADLAGWELKNIADGHEAKFIRKIVEKISLDLRYVNICTNEKLVGMEARVNDIVSTLETASDDVRMIGIWGMGGAGKTTLATAIFNKICFQFEGQSFIENVRELSKASGLKSLQYQILSNILINIQNININNVDKGKEMMKERLSGRKVLIVLDDVDHIEQLEALAGNPSWFKPGSTIIMTTREKQVLIAHGVKIHNANLLSNEEAIGLFSRYAFGREIPVEKYAKLSRKVVSYAAGLPLTLKVLGSFLCGKDKLEWIDTLKRLETIPLSETLKKLEISYISLEEDYKEIFLDVACILKGWHKNHAIQALESCGFHARIALRVLEQKSLLTVDNAEHLGMHDHIQEMGKNIARRSHPDKPSKHSRLWINKEIEDILGNNLGNEATRCVQFYKGGLDSEFGLRGFRNMKELRVLHLSLGVCFWQFDHICSYFPDSLRYLEVHWYPFKSFPKIFHAINLVSIRMPSSNIRQLWEGGYGKVLNKLRFLDLRYSKLRILDIGLTPNLEYLNLANCLFLEKLPEDLGRLRCLKKLILMNCQTIKHIPNSMSNMICLRELHIEGTCIEYLPQSICMLGGLRIFGHRELLQSLGFASKIQTLVYKGQRRVFVEM